MADVYNSEFQDQAARSSFPLDPMARQSFFPDELLLDASIYIPSSFKAPVFISEISGQVAADRIRFRISDAQRKAVCHADCDYDESSAVFMDTYGRAMGVLVYDSEQMTAFRGTIGNKAQEFALVDTRLQSECFRFYDVPGLHTIVADRNSLTNQVNFGFVRGIRRDDDGRVNLYGEQGDLGLTVKSINRVPCQHAFLLSHAHPDYENESAIRLETSSGVIKIGKSRDF